MGKNYIKYVEGPAKEKTRVWFVVNEISQASIGAVKWYGAWRKYCFWPETFSVFDVGCLREIAQFCEDKTKAHKQRQRDA